MDKILIEVFIPVAGKVFEIFVPSELMMHEALELICKMVTQMCDGVFVAGKDTVICHRDTSDILNINLSVSELGLNNGSKLMLI